MAQLSLVPRKPRTAARDDAARFERPAVSPMRLVLHVVEGKQIISAPLRERLIVGRDSENLHLDIDLSPVDGGNSGISRQHAIFHYENAALFVEDLHSTNGTRINGYTIDAGKPYALHNGDEVEFGSLRMGVRLVRMPT
jgi:hypothetical protein